MRSVIETKGLTKSFGDFTAVDDLSISVNKKEVFGLLGPNGAGKTTCINMMVGLLKPTSGHIYIDGEEVSAHSKVVKTKVGVCPQNIVLWPLLTARESLLFIADMYDVPSGTAKDRADGLLSDLQLSDKANEKTKALSGGMKRRLNLAMALVHDPEIVVLDEPSPGLDPQTRLVLWDYIMTIPKQGEGKTVILTTHFMEEADRLSDRVAIIDRGKLLTLDTPENLKNSLGEGDVVEMKFSTTTGLKAIKKTLDGHKDILNVSHHGSKLVITAYNAISRMPVIFNAIPKALDNDVIDLKLRKNTLEDVFISLTGRKLRDTGMGEDATHATETEVQKEGVAQ